MIGDSHILIAKRFDERRPDDAVSVLLQANSKGKLMNLLGLPNDTGHLGKFIVEELDALGFAHAEEQAYEGLAPFLSAWSLYLDIPVHIETIQATNLETQASSLRVHTPHFEMTFPGGLTLQLTQEFCQYASIYREGMNTNSSFYRFLCFYKIIEAFRSDAAG